MKPHYLKLLEEYEKLTTELSGVTDSSSLAKLGKRQTELLPVVEKIQKIQKLEADLEDNKKLLESGDAELAALATEDIKTIEAELIRVEEEITQDLIPKDPNDDNDIIIEIRGGAGGDESTLFAAEMLRAYGKFCETLGFTFKVIASSRSEAGGIKEATIEIKGKARGYTGGPFSWFKYESGVHRVQRVPETEKQGRVHTSTITIAVLPEVEEKDFQIDMKDLNIEATTSSGHGGQSVNTTYSAIRITHLPTGITAQCQDERSQTQNREKALAVIRARVSAHYREIEEKKLKDARKSQVGTGDRSEKIRTYNFPQDRVTDHRINQNFTQIDLIMEGKFLPIIEATKKADAELKKAFLTE